MKIGSNKLDVSPVAATREADAPATASNASRAAAGKDAVALSAHAAGLASISLKGGVHGASEARMKELADALKSGAYRVDHDALASRMIDVDGHS
jgi:anti-sigma28 factor (negative regulator of flagellin synthesis)